MKKYYIIIFVLTFFVSQGYTYCPHCCKLKKVKMIYQNNKSQVGYFDWCVWIGDYDYIKPISNSIYSNFNLPPQLYLYKKIYKISNLIVTSDKDIESINMKKIKYLVILTNLEYSYTGKLHSISTQELKFVKRKIYGFYRFETGGLADGHLISYTPEILHNDLGFIINYSEIFYNLFSFFWVHRQNFSRHVYQREKKQLSGIIHRLRQVKRHTDLYFSDSNSISRRSIVGKYITSFSNQMYNIKRFSEILINHLSSVRDIKIIKDELIVLFKDNPEIIKQINLLIKSNTKNESDIESKMDFAEEIYKIVKPILYHLKDETDVKEVIKGYYGICQGSCRFF